ncbi:hypothetical protein R3P38DRAFT_3139358 [Favolaschia claudopus]|uniref:Uncharacterized protein n=1 Tax=Favolaschia claudopus TaxID=2862362 RepID=A0AAV9Z6I5_9AGAR
MPFQHTAEDSGYNSLPNKVVTALRSSIIITMSTAPESTPTRVRLEDNASLSSTGSFEHDLEPSYTFSELNPELASSAWIGHHRVTQRITVERIEYLNGLPSIFPIPKTPTAFVINLHDPAFEILDERTGQFYALDALIGNKDNDSWRGNTGKGAPAVWVTFGPGEKPIPCRRARLGCTGIYVCERVDPRLLDVERRNLDTASQDRFFAAQLPACSVIVHPPTGLKQRTCAYTHIIDGTGVSSAMVNRECPATRTIFVPVDPSIRKAVVVHPQNIAHNHPIPPLKNATGKVDCGKTPAEYDPALHSAQHKRRLVAETKEVACHDGLDITGTLYPSSNLLQPQPYSSKAATISNTVEVAPKNPVSRKRQADEVDLAHIITTARACKAPKRADTEF